MSSYFGRLEKAPDELREELEGPAMRALVRHGWDPSSVLFFTESRETFDANLGVVATLHAWDEESPLVWVMATVGLSNLRQPFEEPAIEAGTFPRIELATVSNNMSRSGPIPERLAIALADSADLPGWDWDEVKVPPLMEWLFFTAQNFASMIVRDGAVFRLGQFVRGTGNPTPASRLLDLVIVPACPQMLDAGLVPLCDGEPIAVEDWWAEPGVGDCEYGFVWALPADPEEVDVVEADGVGELFARMAERAEVEGREDLFDVAFDFLREPST